MQKFCKKCNIKVKKSDYCRKCSIQNTYERKLEEKILRIITENKQIIDARLSKTSNHNIEVDFNCQKCGCKSTKLHKYFLKNNTCKKCSTSKAASKRNERKYSKNINKIKTYLQTNNIHYTGIEMKKDFIYSEISVSCDNCKKDFKSEFYRIQRFFDINNKILCKKCKKEESKYKHGNSISFYTKNNIGKELGYFYSYSAIVEGKKCYKIGITRNNILRRISKQANNPEDIVYIKMSNLECAVLESKLKKKYKNYNSFLNEKFDGYTEFFDIDVIKKENLKVQRLSPEGEYSIN